MSARPLGIAAAAVLLAVAGAAHAALDVDAVVRRVQARYDATRDFTADVTQEMTVASLGKTVVEHGTVAFKKPGKMRWELHDGEPQIIVADGRTLWLYQPNEQQVLKAPFDAAFRSSTPISFLTGVGRIGRDFRASLDGSGSSAAGPVLYLLLVPRHDEARLGRVRLTVTRAGFDIVGAEIRDPLGNVSRLSFTHVRRNTAIPDDRFVFHPPPGVDVIPAPAAQ